MFNIVHLIFQLETGGSEFMLVDLVNEQIKYANVSIIVVNKIYDDFNVKRISPKVKLICLGRKEGSLNPVVLFKFWNLLLRLNPDVIHCHQHNLIPLLPFWRSKTVVTIHDVGVETKYLKRFKKVFAISTAVQQDLLSRGQINSTVILNGIHITDVKYKASSHSSLSSPYKIVQISRLIHEKKGQHLAIEAIHKIRTVNKQDVQLYFIGAGPSLPYLKELSRKYNLDEFVFFLGDKDRSWIYENLNQFDLLLQPSIYEGFGLTIVEGLAAKLPVIASNVDGPAEILKDIPSGFLFDINKEGDLASSIQKVIELSKCNDFKDSCERSRSIICERYGIKQTVNEYLKSYPLQFIQPAIA